MTRQVSDNEPSVGQAYGTTIHFVSSTAESCIHHIQKDHMLAYIYSGELTIHNGKDEHSFGSGSSVFIRKNHRIRLSIREGIDDVVKIVFLIFKRDFLIPFYRTADGIKHDCAKFDERFLKIDSDLEIKSLFYSILPFIDAGVAPSEKTMELKLMEGMYILLNADSRTAVALFDFIAPWKIDILEFLNENFMYDLTLEEIAQYTGRSLAAFKRDFRKISVLSPSKWIIDKRLEVAHQQLKYQSKNVSDIYLSLGFKSLSHFSTAYKRKYGVPPTRSH
ncbi:MAG TPA: AraC family transcriptional regulator [Sphingobacterium sp.]|nr:AraC family transcriptional regulator [Sphingobacterium sp.]